MEPTPPAMELTTRTWELWPREAAHLRKTRGIDERELRRLFRRVLLPGESRYDAYRVFFSYSLAELPLFIVVLSRPREARSLLEYVAAHRLVLRLRSGGHWPVALTPDVLADISRLDRIRFDPERPGRLKVEGGATQGQVYARLFATAGHGAHFPGGHLFHPLAALAIHRLLTAPAAGGVPGEEEEAFPGGTAVTVGAVGITSVGGLGALKRTLGLTADWVTSMRVVLPPQTVGGQARTVTASRSENAELFWALRGGVASNFGIVLSMDFRLPQVGGIVFYTLRLPLACARRALPLWQATAVTRPAAFNEEVAVFSVTSQQPAGPLRTLDSGFAVSGIYVLPAGQTLAEARVLIRRALAPLTSLPCAADTSVVFSEVTEYAEAVRSQVARRTYQPLSAVHVVFSSTPVDVDRLLAHLQQAAQLPGTHALGIELLGGAVAHPVAPGVTADAVAFAGRQAQFMYDVFSYWGSSATTCANRAWVEQLVHQLYQPDRPTDLVYAGFPIDRLPRHLRAYFGANRCRLRRIKAAVDPLGVLHFPAGIRQLPGSALLAAPAS